MWAESVSGISQSNDQPSGMTPQAPFAEQVVVENDPAIIALANSFSNTDPPTTALWAHYTAGSGADFDVSQFLSIGEFINANAAVANYEAQAKTAAKTWLDSASCPGEGYYGVVHTTLKININLTWSGAFAIGRAEAYVQAECDGEYICRGGKKCSKYKCLFKLHLRDQFKDALDFKITRTPPFYQTHTKPGDQELANAARFNVDGNWLVTATGTNP
jgi:hypothetical protein